MGENNPIIIPFRKWELYELPSLRPSNREIWSTKTLTNLEKPRFVIVAFQVNRKNNPINVRRCIFSLVIILKNIKMTYLIKKYIKNTYYFF